jgi:pimeloyl-ACP methyl ester carboxylesterase
MLAVAGVVIVSLVASTFLAAYVFGVPLNPIAAPVGPYAVGSFDFVFTDPNRSEIFTEANLPRRVPAQILYPIAKAKSGSSPYMAHAQANLANVAKVHGRFLATLLKGVTRLEAPVSTAQVSAAVGQLPVIVYLPGVTGYREMNSFQTLDLAAHGYVVIVLDQPGNVGASVMPDGMIINGLDRAEIESAVRPEYMVGAAIGLPSHISRWRTGQRSIIPYLAADASLVLDQLSVLSNDPSSPIAGKLDTMRIGVFGMSLGAIVAARACSDDRRFGACLMMDAAMPIDVAKNGLRQPALWLTRSADAMRQERRSAGGWPEAEITITQSSMHEAAQQSNDGVIVEFPGSYHISFTDIAELTPVLRWLGIAPDIDVLATHREIAVRTRRFFDQKLKPARKTVAEHTR